MSRRTSPAAIGEPAPCSQADVREEPARSAHSPPANWPTVPERLLVPMWPVPTSDHVYFKNANAFIATSDMTRIPFLCKILDSAHRLAEVVIT